MSHEQKRLEDCLAHIIEAIERIENYVADMDKLNHLQRLTQALSTGKSGIILERIDQSR